MRHSYVDPGGCWATASLLKLNDDRWIVSGVETRSSQRGNGAGSRLLAQICADADREDVTLILMVSSDCTPGSLTNEQLTEWYRRHGFIQMADIGEFAMERTPR